MRASMDNSARNVRRVLNEALGKKCWHVTVGGCTLPQFTLALGNKVRRQEPIRNPTLPSEYRDFEGEISFFVRCWWRLEHGSSVLASSTDNEDKITSGLNCLVGKALVRTSLSEPAWDLVLEFSNEWCLRLFSNQTDNADDLLKNWHARIRDQKVYAGPGAKIEIVD